MLIINMFITLFTSIGEDFENDILVQCCRKLHTSLLLLSRHKKLSFAFCIALRTNLAPGFFSSWLFKPQQEPAENPPNPEAELVSSPPGSQTALIHALPLRAHSSQGIERLVYFSPLPDCEVVMMILSRAFRKTPECRVGQDRG